MSLLTNWGYTIADADALTPMLTLSDFNAITADKYAGDVRIEPNLNAACAAIRSYCGWHVYPVQACSMTERLLAGNGRVKRVGPDLLIQLPAAFVTGMSSITVDGVEHPGLQGRRHRPGQDRHVRGGPGFQGKHRIRVGPDPAQRHRHTEGGGG